MKNTLLIILVFVCSNIFAQSEKTDYFQQYIKYDISAKINTSKHTIESETNLEYKNNSGDTLDFIYFHIYANAYASDSSALCKQLLSMKNSDLYFATENERAKVEILEFYQNNELLDFDYYKNNTDVVKIYLNKAILPNESDKLHIKYKFRFPLAKYSRMGISKKRGDDFCSYKVSQWYPKPAVYDKDGWHPQAYLNIGEFYGEFADFNVKIEVPIDYQIASTGNLSKKTDSSGKSLFHFKAKNIHDFAFYLNKNLNIDTDSVVLSSGKTVYIKSYYRDIRSCQTGKESANINWLDAIEYAKKSVAFFSDLIGDYPYDKFIVIEAPIAEGAGMEYPGLCIIEPYSSPKELEKIIAHEVAHNWFYASLAFNERDEPWLDEGLTSYYQYRYEQKFLPSETLSDVLFGGLKIFGAQSYRSVNMHYYSYYFSQSRNLNQAINLNSTDYSYYNYIISVYNKSVIAFLYLENYLGNDEFDKLISRFYKKWQGKHPQSKDFEEFLKDNAQKNIDWFFDNLISKNDNIDFKIKNLKKKKDSLILKIKSSHSDEYPFELSAFDKNSNLIESKWIMPSEKISIVSFKKDSIAKFVINSKQIIPEFNQSNNEIEVNSIFKKAKLPKPKFIYKIPNPQEKYFYLSPALAWNNYNKAMIGLAVYNDYLFERKWQYSFIPLYSFKTKNVNGVFEFYRNLDLKADFIRKISLGIKGKKFNFNNYVGEKMNYYKLQSNLEIYFQHPSHKPFITNKLSFRFYDINKQKLQFIDKENYNKNYQKYNIIELDYNYENEKKINRYSLQYNLQLNKQFVKTSIEFKQKLNFSEKKSFDIRIFAGNIFKLNEANPQFNYSFNMNSTFGTKDYLFNNSYFDRSARTGSNLWANQTYLNDGGFAIPTIIGNSFEYILAVNLKTSIPKVNFIRLYANIGAYPYENYFQKSPILYETGIMLNIIPDNFEIYFPIFYSQDIKDVHNLNNYNSYNQKISFILQLDNLNIFKFLRNIQI